MLLSIRYNKNAGNSAIFAHFRNGAGYFWNMVTLLWVPTETADCRVFFTEHADSDTAESLFICTPTVPENGPWIVQVFRADTGAALGNDTTAIDATISSRSTFAGGAVASVADPVTVGTNNDKTGYALTTAYDSAKTAASQSSVSAIPTAPLLATNYVAPDNTTISAILTETQSHPTLTEIEASTVLAKEGTVSSRLASADYTAPPSAASISAATWGATDRTLTGFGSLVADIAAAIWSATSRTLTAFGFSVAVADKTGYSLATDYDAAKTAATQTSMNSVANGVADVQTGINLLLTEVGTLLDIGQGKWEIANNQMIFYKKTGVELMRFNLQDASGAPNMSAVFKRIPT